MKILGSSPQVLIVDDDDAVRKAVSTLLAKHGYLVCQASSAAGALQLLESTQIDLVVLDVGIGRETGLDLLDKIRATYPSVYVVMLTGRGYDEATWQAARARGAHGYLSKTLPPTHLLMEVDRWLKFRGEPKAS
jgi:DNA-binding response OmpR family regulator